MSDARDLTMSAKELDRLEIISRVVERRLTQQMAAGQLGLGLRQVERLCRAFRTAGAAGLVSRKCGSPSNRKLDTTVRERAVACVRGHYADFGPTLACEKLIERHGFRSGQGHGNHPVRSRSNRAKHRHHLRQHAPGQGPCRARSSDATRSTCERASPAGDFDTRSRQRVPPSVSDRLQRAIWS